MQVVFLNSGNVRSLLTRRKGPTCPGPSTKFNREKRVWTAAALRGPLQKVPTPQFQTVPLTGVPWGFYTQSNIPESKISVGEDMWLHKMGKGWLWTWWVVSGQSISGTGPSVQLEIWKWIPLKFSVPAFSVGSLHVSPKGLYIPVSSDLGWVDYGTEIKRK